MSGPHEGWSFLHCSYPIYSPLVSITWQLGMAWLMFCASCEARCISLRAESKVVCMRLDPLW